MIENDIIINAFFNLAKVIIVLKIRKFVSEHGFTNNLHLDKE